MPSYSLHLNADEQQVFGNMNSRDGWSSSHIFSRTNGSTSSVSPPPYDAFSYSSSGLNVVPPGLHFNDDNQSFYRNNPSNNSNDLTNPGSIWLGGSPRMANMQQNSASNQQVYLPGSSGISQQKYAECMAKASKMGFVVGMELERVKEKSRHNNSQSFCRISAHFKNKYGETDSKTKAAYLQIGVRVPSKDHVSEIVGKGGSKIKSLREETGALITTPGENEDHVFIIEAPPEIAFRVGQMIKGKAEEITLNKTNERRRGSGSNYPNRVLLARGRISVPQEMVGKIIGTQGSIITTIQKDTGTEIKSPPKDVGGKEAGSTADFEISAYQSANLQCIEAAENRIRQAKQLIGHLVMRQLERRDEEENSDDINRDSGLSSQGDQDSDHQNNLRSSPNSSSSNWIWTDVVQMDPREAREVIDRILQESKNKTKKVLKPDGSPVDEIISSAGSPELSRLALSGSASMGHRGSFGTLINGCESPSNQMFSGLASSSSSSNLRGSNSNNLPNSFGLNQARNWPPEQQFGQRQTVLSSGTGEHMGRNNNSLCSSPWHASHQQVASYFMDPLVSASYGDPHSQTQSSLRRGSAHGSLDRLHQSGSNPNGNQFNANNNGSSMGLLHDNTIDSLGCSGGGPIEFMNQSNQNNPNIQSQHQRQLPYVDDYSMLSRDMARLNMLSSEQEFYMSGNGNGSQNNGNPMANNAAALFGNDLSRTMSDTSAANYARKLALVAAASALQNNSNPNCHQSEFFQDPSQQYNSVADARWTPNSNFDFTGNDRKNNQIASDWRHFSQDPSLNVQGHQNSDEFDYFAATGGNTVISNTISNDHWSSFQQQQLQRGCGIIGDRRRRSTPSPNSGEPV